MRFRTESARLQGSKPGKVIRTPGLAARLKEKCDVADGVQRVYRVTGGKHEHNTVLVGR
jgi:hypothetical protein